MTRRKRFETPNPWPPLTTPRLILREFREDDLGDLHAYGSDPEVTRFMTWGPNTPGESRQFLDRKLTEQAVWPRPGVSLAAELIAERSVIGALELRLVDAVHRTAELGYSFARAHWGHGYGAEAAGALIRHGFETLGLHRIVATCDIRNTGSWRVMEKLGMRREALLRKDKRVRRRWRDTYLYAILASDWRARHNRLRS